jgi:integral membrane protein
VPNPYPLLRGLCLVEGVSFLVLLFVAMPLKYLGGQPLAVTIAGWIHGALFLAFLWSWQHARTVARWPAARARRVFVAALLPFGPFVIDRGMRAWEQDWLRAPR